MTVPLEFAIAGLAGYLHDAPWPGGQGRAELVRQSRASGYGGGINTTEDPGDALYVVARDRIRRAVAELLKDTGLHVRELTYELVITNPRDPEKGQVHVAYQDGLVSWERVTWVYWGQLEVFDGASGTEVSAVKIINALTGTQ
jgi:hypothetical protein